jgi:pyruvate dehydrogenase E2 component (dihydrolipoamide acetyltransferase)
VDDIAVMVAEAVAKRVKEAQARQAATVKGAASAAPQPQAVARPPAPAPPSAVPPPRAVAPARPAAAPLPAPDAPRPIQTIPLLAAFAGAGPLLSAFILREALDKPLALREGPRF